jgi:hypothetical protein
MATVARKPGHRGEHEGNRKTIAQGRPDASAEPVCSCAFFLCASCTRDRGCSAHPAFPAPSVFRGQVIWQTSGAFGRENASVYLLVCLKTELKNHLRRPGPPHESLRLLRSLKRSSASSCAIASRWLRISSLWRLASLPSSATVSAIKATASSGPPSPSGTSLRDRRSLPEAVRFRPPPALLKKITPNPA